MKDWLDFAKQHPHEFTIQYPPRREYFKEFFEQPPQKIFNSPKDLLLYVHVPFCEAKCYYCNFAVDVRNKTSVFVNYTEALCKELEAYQYLIEEGCSFHGIDIGGGTPSLLPIELLEKILIQLRPFAKSSSHSFPISIETTPNIAANNLHLLKMMVAYGIQRVSMGIQSFNIEKLRDINRNLQVQKNELAIQNIREAGFKRFNADLIFGLPQQSIKDWELSLQQIIKLAPDSITTYDCLYRGKGRSLTRKTKTLPSLETYGEMYDLAYQMLTENGYFAAYGSVNFSKIENETGTSAYFEGRLLDGKPYLGLGNYSSSQIDNYWCFNTYKVDDYIQRVFENRSVIGDFYLLPEDELYAKYILYSLNYGFIDKDRFFNRFGVDIYRIFEKEILFAINNNWLEQDQNRLNLAPNQFNKMNLIRSLFYSKKSKKWLKNLISEK